VARFLAWFALWLAFSIGCGYCLAAMGANSFGALWVGGSSAFAACCLAPLLICGLPDD
jgi:hypothetical protein